MKYHELIHRAQTGDAQAQGELYEAMYKRVYYLTLRITNSPEDAQDAAQDAFLSAFQALPKLKNPDAFESWLFQIAANKARGILRKNGRTVALAEDEDGRTMLDDLPDENEALLPEEVVDSADKRDIILSLIDGLPEAQRVCLVMFYYAELSVKQIAQELRCSENTVKSRLNYARQKIRQAVLDTEERDGIRLHAAAPLALLFAKDFEALAVDIPALAASAATAATGAEAAGEALAAAETAAGTAAETGAVSSAVSAAAKTGILATAKAKIAAGVVAALLLAGGGAVVVSQTGDAPADSPAPSVSQSESTEEKDWGEPAPETDEEGRLDAYRQIVQELVNEYGGPRARNENDEHAFPMVTAVELVDITGDGLDELIVCWEYDTDQEYCKMGSAIYSYGDGKAKELWYDPDDSFDAWRIMKQGETYFILETETYRGWCNSILAMDNGVIADIYQWDYTLTAEDEAWLQEQSMMGINTEQMAHQTLALRQIGVDWQAECEDVHGFTVGYGDLFYSNWDEAQAEFVAHVTANMDALGVRLPQPKVSAEEVLAKIPYIGDRSICKMDKDMAKAYADAIEKMEKTRESGRMLNSYGSKTCNLYITLADPAGDGMPILMAVYQNKNHDGSVYGGDGASFYGFADFDIWEYENGVARKTNIDYGEYATFGRMNGTGALNTGPAYTAEPHDYYSISNAQVDYKYSLESFLIYGHTYSDGYRINGELPEGADYDMEDENALEEHGWLRTTWGDDPAWSLILKNGKPVTNRAGDASLDEAVGFTATEGLYSTWEGDAFFDRDTIPAADAAAALRSYASAVGRPVYSYNDVTTVLSADEIDQIAKLLAKELKGEIGEVYRLSDDLLYIVLYVDGEVSGCATVKQTLTDGKAGFRLVSATEEAAPESDLQAQVQEDQTHSNITLDYSDSGDDKSAYLTDALNNIDGAAVNDAAKGEIAAYVETAVSEASVTDVKCRKNAAVLTDKTIQESLTQAESEKAALDEALDGVELNKSLTIVLRVVCTNLTEGQPVQVTFEPSMLDAMADAQAVQVILGDGQHSVTISAEALTALCQTHGKLTVLLQRTEDGAYTITLLDDQDQVIPKTEEALTFTLPAESPNATVLASYEGGSDNWGGQYDSINGAIEFMTPYSGTYEVMENQVDINDLTDCGEETAEAIRFMVSRGYFDLTDGSFDPNGTLNRYDFAQALVKMFFALDRSLTTSFTDVPEDSEYYPYVASGEQDAIIEGFQDGTFRGEKDVLVEQVIALCSRTLADKKGYTYPETPADYLKFEDADEISDWALETTALAVREGLIEGTGTLGPQEPISRGDAAMMLYRLFMLLYEPPAAEITVVDTSSNAPVLPIALGVAAVAAAGAGAVIWKKKKTPAEVSESTPEPEPEDVPEPEDNEQEEA